MVNFEKFIAAYKTASPEMREFIDSGKIGEFCESKISGTGLDKLKGKMIVELSNRILSVTDKESMLTNLIQHGFTDDFITSRQSDIENFVNSVLNSSPMKAADLAKEIIATEAALNAIPTIRTMASEAQQASPENTYTSTQSAILGENKAETTTPPTPPPPASTSAPRWGSDNS